MHQGEVNFLHGNFGKQVIVGSHRIVRPGVAQITDEVDIGYDA